MTVLRCEGSTYISVGRSEPDDPLQQIAECNGPSVCGWQVVMREWSVPQPDGQWDVNVTSEDFLPLHEQHLAHSATL